MPGKNATQALVDVMQLHFAHVAKQGSDTGEVEFTFNNMSDGAIAGVILACWMALDTRGRLGIVRMLTSYLMDTKEKQHTTKVPRMALETCHKSHGEGSELCPWK